MKQRFLLFALFAMLTGSFLSCSSSATYAELLSDEKSSIKSFMQIRGYTLTDKIPTTVPWPDSVFYKTESGMYIHVIDTGTTVVKDLPDYKAILVRFVEYDMNDTLTNENMYSAGGPSEILYNKVSTASNAIDCKAWHEALDYVGDYGHVYIIAPAEIGMSAYSTAVTAHFYDLRYTFAK
ncbi:MAG TPA: DUF4827 family protein [Bacteroidales bacterium]